MKSNLREKVVVLGASDKPERYAYKAFKMLKEYNHEVFLVHPKLAKIDGEDVFSSLEDLPENHFDTCTLYLRPQISNTLIESLIRLRPTRIILNPGTENEELEDKMKKAGIATERACTLVLLSTEQF